MDDEELTAAQQELNDILKSALEKKRHPWETPLTPLENEVYKQILPTLLNNAIELYREERKKYEERING